MAPEIVPHPWFTSWGPASIDWCEPNYAVTPMIAEFWNTMSSLLMCVVATYALYWKWKAGSETRYLLLEVAIWIVGFGSALFHGTLTFYGQLADELPMLYGAFLWAYVILHQTKKRGVVDWLVVIGLSVLAIAWTFASSVLHYHYNWIFEVVFALITLGCMWLLFRFTLRSKSRWARRLFATYVVLTLVSFAIWNLDQIYCSSLQGVYAALPHFTSLHGYWHVGMSLAMYAATLLITMLRHEVLTGQAASLQWTSILPIMSPSVPKHQ